MSTESLRCVFIPPKFHVSDVVSIVYFCDEAPNPLPSLKMRVEETEYNLAEPKYANGRVTWSVDDVCDFEEAAPEARSFELVTETDEKIVFQLENIAFLGPSKTASPPKSLYLFECISGLYARSEDFHEETVTFTVDSLLTLDYRNVLAIRQKLEELTTAQKAFEDRKEALQQAGIDLNRLANLKAQYEECMRKKRRVQHEFLKQNQRMQAAMIKNQCQQDYETAVESLRKHIEENKQKAPPAEPPRASYEKLLRFRVAALEELKMIFPFVYQEKSLCGVHYTPTPTSAQWGEMKAFLGFATHYIREVSRIVGIPLQYSLIPMASASRVVCRLTDETRQIPNEYKPETKNTVAAYENALVQCCKHIGRTLLMQIDDITDLPGHLQLLNCITSRNLETLIPMTRDETARSAPVST